MMSPRIHLLELILAKVNLAELLAKKEALEEQIEAARLEETENVIAHIKELIAAYELSAADLGLKARKKAGSLAGRHVAPKYQGPAGETWAGRGRKPRWLVDALKKGKKLEEFAI